MVEQKVQKNAGCLKGERVSRVNVNIAKYKQRATASLGQRPLLSIVAMLLSTSY
jgi:hypothetical protein